MRVGAVPRGPWGHLSPPNSGRGVDRSLATAQSLKKSREKPRKAAREISPRRRTRPPVFRGRKRSPTSTASASHFFRDFRHFFGRATADLLPPEASARLSRYREISPLNRPRVGEQKDGAEKSTHLGDEKIEFRTPNEARSSSDRDQGQVVER